MAHHRNSRKFPGVVADLARTAAVAIEQLNAVLLGKRTYGSYGRGILQKTKPHVRSIDHDFRHLAYHGLDVLTTCQRRQLIVGRAEKRPDLFAVHAAQNCEKRIFAAPNPASAGVQKKNILFHFLTEVRPICQEPLFSANRRFRIRVPACPVLRRKSFAQTFADQNRSRTARR